MGKENFLNSNIWREEKVQTKPFPDYRIDDLSGFSRIVTLDSKDTADHIGSDDIEWRIGQAKNPDSTILVLENPDRTFEVFTGERVAVFFNPDDNSVKIAVFQKDTVILRVRPNICTIGIMQYPE